MTLKPLAIFTTLIAVTGLGAADDPKVAFNPHMLPPAKSEPAKMPTDGNGIFRLTLDGALGAAPLIVLLEIEDGKATNAVALPAHLANAWCPTDASKLVFKDGQLSGAIAIECIPQFALAGPHSRRFGGKDNPAYKTPHELKPTVTATIDLDAKTAGLTGTGTFTAKWNLEKGKEMPFGHQMRPSEKGTLTLRRESMRAVPAKFDCDLFLPSGLGDSTLAQGLGKGEPSLWLRLAMEKGTATRAFGFICISPPKEGNELVWNEVKVTFQNGKLTGRLKGAVKDRPEDVITLEVEGRALGRCLIGTVAFQHGDTKVTTQWLGTIYDVGAWRLPMELPRDKWNWSHDRPADAALTALAIEESVQPVMPGEPGKAGFWTWQRLAKNSQVTTIYPPSFDIREVEDAAKYRFAVSGTKEVAGKKFEFTADKPWRPLAPIWKAMPVGSYQLTVTALDPQGKELPGPLQHRIIDKATAKPIDVELKTIALTKRPAFSGPYTTPSQDWLDAALTGSRWSRESLGLPDRRIQVLGHGANHWTGGGDHGYGMVIAADIWANLATRALTDDPAERLIADEMLALKAEALEIHQRTQKPAGYIYDYQSNTPMAHWPGEAILDAYLQTGDPRWKAMAMKLGEALVLMQKSDGAFLCNRGFPDKMVGPHGFFSWREGNTDYAAVELLYFFGRLRRDLKTDAFLQAETKAYDWTMKVAVRERHWPLNLAHSASQGYPITTHGNAALYFCRYLLECAPPERRDLELAGEVARWAEDICINWQRAPEGKQTSQLTPRVERFDRYNNEPVAMNLLAAVVFEELAQATGNKLWAAKGDTLATAVLQARNPKTGRLSVHLEPATETFVTRQFHDASFRHGTFCNEWAVQLLREYAALRADAHKK